LIDRKAVSRLLRKLPRHVCNIPTFNQVLEKRFMNTSLQRRLLIAIALVPMSLLQSRIASPQDAKTSIAIKATVDRADAIYQVGEMVTFSVEATLEGKPVQDGTVVGVLSKDGVQPQPPQTLELKDGKATLRGKLDEPGFLLLRATIGKTTAMASAGYDPLLLKPSMKVPDDFDTFWAAQKSSLAAVSIQSHLTPAESPVKGVDTFDLQVDCLGPPVSGYFGLPQNAKPKTLPAILFVHGAGVRSSSLGSTQWATKEGGMLVLDINAHGIPNGKSTKFYEDFAAGELKDYRSMGREDREKCYFKGMFLRLIRAMDYLTQRPEWDGKTLIVYGSSQGGFQAIVAAGLDSRVTFICAGVPAGCDHTGTVANRINGWPKLVPLDSAGKPDPATQQSARYFDCVNFATRAKCKGAAVTVGFIDTTCPPTSVYAAYNALGVTKSIHTDVLSGHTNTPAASKFMQDAAIQHVRKMKLIEP
jgi:cephalosporin-C deacetylase